MALYRRGEFDAAASVFQDALTTDDRRFEADAIYNLAQSLHESAVQGAQNTESAVLKLSRAIGFYEDVLRLSPDHPQATNNLVLARRLMRFFEARLADEREQPEPRQGSQPQEGGSSEDSQRQSSADDQQAAEEAQREDGPPEQEGKPSPSDESQTEGEQGESGKKGDPAEGAGNQRPRQSDQPQQSDTALKPIPIEEAQAMLQDARDAELRRRAALRRHAMQQQQRTRPEKDW